MTEDENATLRAIARDLHWMARRYADGRMTYAASTVNEHTRTLLALGVKLNPTGDGTIWARDGMGRAYDHLSDEEAAQGRPYDYVPPPDLAEYERLRAALRTIQQHYGQVCPAYEACDHPACWSSYGAWAVADGALSGEE